MGGDRTDFFISHTGADRAWAEWVAWQLVEAGYTVELDVWDWATGRSFVTAMSDALDRCDRVMALWSTEYFSRSRYTTGEWSGDMVQVPGADAGRLVPLRIEDVPTDQVPGVFRPLVYRDLFGLGEDEAARVLLEAVRDSAESMEGPRPESSVHRPGHAAGADPGTTASRGSGGRAGSAWDGRGR